MIRLLAIDLDGTLFNSQHAIGPADRQALDLAREAGLGLLVATGRGRRGVEMGLERIGLDLPHICSAGALIRPGRGAAFGAYISADGRVPPCAPVCPRAWPGAGGRCT